MREMRALQQLNSSYVSMVAVGKTIRDETLLMGDSVLRVSVRYFAGIIRNIK